ncbi:hypothetical protein Bca4012_001957 [Brassica carinata]
MGSSTVTTLALILIMIFHLTPETTAARHLNDQMKPIDVMKYLFSQGFPFDRVPPPPSLFSSVTVCTFSNPWIRSKFTVTVTFVTSGVSSRKWSNEELQRLGVFARENSNPNFNILVKNAALQNQHTVSSVLSRPSVKEESFRMVLPLVMSPPRDKAVPLPVLPEPMMKPQKKLGRQETMFAVGKSRYHEKNLNHEEESFNCSAFCLSLLGFGKKKTARSPKSKDSSIKKKMIKGSSFSNSIVSLGASFEKFEYGSWVSATALARENDRLYFDLPLEMIQCGRAGGGNVQEPVSSGLLLDKETESLALKSVLKTSLSGREERSLAETSSQRLVRFSNMTSVSCPNSPRSSITSTLA